MTLGEYLKKERENLGLSQAQVAKHLGWSSAQFVSNIERDTAVIPPKKFNKWCDYVQANRAKAFELLKAAAIDRLKCDVGQ